MFSIFCFCSFLCFRVAGSHTDNRNSKRILLSDQETLTTRLESLEAKLQQQQATILQLTTAMQTIQGAMQGHGSTYIRWGRGICSGVDTQLIYSGFAAGEKYSYGNSYKGGASNMLCLPSDPDLSSNTTGSDSNIYGTEYQDSHFGPGLANEDVPCAVCRSTSTSTSIMIPGRKTCYSGWKEEYAGIIASGAYYDSASSFICVDSQPNYVSGGSKRNYENVLFITRTKCGSLSCPPYNDNRQVNCVVCSK